MPVLRPLLLSSLLTLSLTATGRAATDQADASPAQRYIIHLQSPPAALFEGFAGATDARKRALAPTHPATAGKARLQVASSEVKAYRSFLADERAAFTQSAGRVLGREPKALAEIDLVLNAVVLELAPAEAERLAQLPGVSRVEPDFVRRPMGDAGPAWVGAPAVWSGQAGAPTRGAGVLVGVIDTGLNPAHPAFAGRGPVDGHVHTFARSLAPSLCASPTSPPCNGKLVVLRDLSFGSSSRESDNGLDLHGHGSHVAGTAVGNTLRAANVASDNAEREVSGVAPHAHLAAYKACEVEARCVGSWLVAAINAAVADGVDVINYSIGGDPGSPWTSSDALALLAAREAGIVPVVAAGNDGPGLGSVTSPGNAPWVISVANISHDRSIGSRVVDFTGGSANPPGGGSLLGAGASAGYGPAKIVFPTDFPGCGRGEGLGLDNTGEPDGSSNPWSGNPNRFNGEIVVCMRGTQARLAKSDNVRRAGGGGMILLNGVGDSESVLADAHSIPSTHLGFRAGEQLKAWLFAGGERARIEGVRLIQDPSLGNRLSASSGRGPVSYGGVMLPSIAAPGTSILSASHTDSGLRILSGTSMAAPHVAGAAALLRALKPEWRADQIQSALMLSARPGLVSEDAITPARRIDIGAGGLDVAAAARVGLALETSGREFRSARPSAGGQPRRLNLPGLVHEACLDSCSLSRTLRDVAGGGRWRASVSLPGGNARVQPESFELAPGASQRLEVLVDLSRGADIGRWLDGEIRLARLDAAGELRMPLAVFASAGDVPSRLDLGPVADAGLRLMELAGIAALDSLVVEAGALTPVRVASRALASGSSTEDAYAFSQSSAFHFLLELPAATSATPRRFRLIAETSAATGATLGLYAGIDNNGNGQPDESEQLCVAKGSSPRCELDLAQTGSLNRLWVMSRNESGLGRADAEVELRAALLDPKPSGQGEVAASAPASVPAGAVLPLRLSWNDPAFQPGERRAFLLSLRSRAGLEPFARIPVSLLRDTSAPTPRPLVEGRGVSLKLAPGESRKAFFIDVPADTQRLTLSAEGGDVRIDAIRDPAPTMPLAVPPANLSPSLNGVVGRSSSTEVPTELLAPGRIWAVVRNVGSEVANTSISLRMDTGQRVQPRFGAWYNPQRSGAGMFLHAVGTNWGLLWYSYLEDGTPTWYVGSAPAPQASEARWTAPLQRMVWSGGVARPTQVGRVVIAATAENRMQMSFELDGQFGSEPMQWIGSERCASVLGQSLDLNGLWYDASNSGFGYSLDVSPEAEVVASFLYDGRGWPRWVLGSGRPFGAGPIDLLQFRGACPLCEHSPVQSQPAGRLQVLYANGQPATIETAIDFVAPLSGSWVRSHPLSRLTSSLGCPP